mgnify:FL=1
MLESLTKILRSYIIMIYYDNYYDKITMITIR